MATNTQTPVIRRLEESLINRIAAGEIIHRPASALKELLENALDAGATSIKITVKDGGLKLLQIQDNGSGIRKADLPILCERFTTSKLTSFQDLSALTTYGFRGEALASISHVAHLSVVTKTKADSCAWRACYSDGVLAPPKPGLSVDPKPCAGNDGTLLTVEDLFYNTPTRLAALRSGADEYKRILDVVTNYAVHNPSIAFQCKKAGQAQTDVSTPGSATVLQAIALLYGASLSKELVHVKLDDQKAIDKDSSIWSAEAFASNPNHQSKRFTFLLFINHRLVDSSRIKRAMEAVYNGILPKGSAPFVYLSLLLDPKDVDANVHPTKREVHFLHEEAITEIIADQVQLAVTKQGTTRTFVTQTLLTGGTLDEAERRPNKRRKIDEEEEESTTEVVHIQPKKVYSHHKVRTSAQDQTLDQWIPVKDKESASASREKEKAMDELQIEQAPKIRAREIKESICRLSSVLALRDEVKKQKHVGMCEIIEKHTFVGVADFDQCLSLIQADTKLYLVNHASLAEELFYQLGLRQFGDFHRIKLEPPPPLRELIQLAVSADEAFHESGLDVDTGTNAITDILMARRDMLDEYFSLNIDAEGRLQEIPLLLRDYKPDLDKLPLLLMRLGPQVDWGSERGCFETLLRELAYFYAPDVPEHISQALAQLKLAEENADVQAVSEEVGAQGLTVRSEGEKAIRWQIQHVLFPTIRRYLVPSKALLTKDFVQVANLPDLYKVFERC